MKTFLRTVRKALAYKVLFALASLAAAANAHDLPYSCPFASDAWQALGENCLGLEDNASTAIARPGTNLSAVQELPNMAFASPPDFGQPPAPKNLPIEALSSTFTYDGVDCSKLESMYRAAASDVAASDVVSQAEIAGDVQMEWPASVAPFRLDRTLASAGQCDFQSPNDAALVQVSPRTRYIFRHSGIQDTSWLDFACLTNDGLANGQLTLLDTTQLAQIEPTAQLSTVNIADLFRSLETWECQAYAEMSDLTIASQLGSTAATFSKAWQQTFANQSQTLIRLLNTRHVEFQLPLFVIHQTELGPIALPRKQSQQCELALQYTAPEPRDIEDFNVMLKLANSRLKWAGGRLSQAAVFIQDWFSDRVAVQGESHVR